MVFKAEVLVFDGNGPAIFVAAGEDPLAAVVLNSSILDSQTVTIDGIIRKEEERMQDVEVERPSSSHLGISEGRKLRWEDIRRKVTRSCNVLHERISGTDTSAAEEAIMDAFGMDRQSLVL